MTIYKTLADAKAAVVETDRAIAEIQHATEGRCFVRIGCSLETLRMVLKCKPIPVIVNLVREHEAHAPVAIHLHCERCRKALDAKTAMYRPGTYRMGGNAIKTNDPYCAACARDLQLQEE